MNFSVTALGGRWHAPHPRQPQRRPTPQSRAGPEQEEPGQTVLRQADPLLAEHSRLQVAALNQAIEATERALALVQAAGCGLEAISESIGSMQALLLAAGPQPDAGAPGAGAPGADGTGAGGTAAEGTAAEGTVRPAGCTGISGSAWAALQQALAEQCRAIDALAEQTRFGQTRLLDGSLGCRAAAAGEHLQLVAVGGRVRSSPPEGYAVLLTQEPTRATLLAEQPLTPEAIASGVRLEVREGGRSAAILTRPGQDAQGVVQELNSALDQQGLDVRTQATSAGRLLLQHRRCGRAAWFEAQSSLPGLLSEGARPQRVANGQDIAGSMHGEPCLGEGQLLSGRADNRCTAGLVVRYFDPIPAASASDPRPAARAAPDGWKQGRLLAGRVLVVQQCLELRVVSAETPAALQDQPLRLDSMRCRDLGRGPHLTGEVPSLEHVPHAAPDQAAQALAVIRQAGRQAEAIRRQVQQALHTALPAHLETLREHAEHVLAGDHPALTDMAADVWAANLSAAQSVLPQAGADGPGTLVRDLLLSIPLQGQRALLAQHHPPAPAMLRLLAEPDQPGAAS